MDISNWIVFSSVVSAIGVTAAVWIAVAGARERWNARYAEQLAEARMVRVGMPSSGEARNEQVLFVDEQDDLKKYRTFTWAIVNHGPHPIFDIYYQAWTLDEALTANPQCTVHCEFGAVGADLTVTAEFRALADGNLIGKTKAWRVIWRDRYGNRWVVDHKNLGAEKPREFKDRERPQPDGSPQARWSRSQT